MKNIFLFGLFPVLTLLSCSHPKSDDNKISGKTEIDRSLLLKDGFKAYIVADNLGNGRHITVNQNGDIYVSLRRLNNNGGIVALRDTDEDYDADIIEYFGDYAGTGIGLHKGFLYFGSDDKVMRYKLTSGELLPDPLPEIIAEGFPEQNQHAVKPFAFDGNGNIYINVGGPSNACMEQMRTKGSPGMDPCPQLERHAGIWQFKDDVPGQDQVQDGHRYATGLRNSVAIAWNDNTDQLYVVQHGRDQLSQFFPDMYTDEDNAELPAEEFFLLEDGSDGGWPYCYYDQFQNKKLLAPEYGGNRSITGRCEEKTDPIMAFPGHLAPNDLIFYTGDQFPERYKHGAFIAFHGSWNRGPLEQEGFYVVFVPFEGSYPSGDWEIFADNFDGLDKVMSPGDAKHRPCGLAQGPDGSLYVVDSREGKVWRIMYEG